MSTAANVLTIILFVVLYLLVCLAQVGALSLLFP